MPASGQHDGDPVPLGLADDLELRDGDVVALVPDDGLAVAARHLLGAVGVLEDVLGDVVEEVLALLPPSHGAGDALLDLLHHPLRHLTADSLGARRAALLAAGVAGAARGSVAHGLADLGVSKRENRNLHCQQ